VELPTALNPAEHRVPCVDEEFPNIDCVSGVFMTATVRTHNYNIYVDKYVGTYIIILFQKNAVELGMLKVKGEYLIGSVFSW
jgi:hypothetical protein